MFARAVLDLHDRAVVRLMPDCLLMTADCCAAHQRLTFPIENHSDTTSNETDFQR